MSHQAVFPDFILVTVADENSGAGHSMVSLLAFGLLVV